MNRRASAVSLMQASQNNPTLAKLMGLQRESSARLLAIQTLIPAPLRGSVQAGPLEEGIWCLLLANNTMTAKLRQLLPSFEAHLRVSGLEVKSIRLKVRRPDGV